MSFELVGVRMVAEDAAKYMAAMAAGDKAVATFGAQSASTFQQMPGLSDIAVGALHKIGAIATEAFAAAGRAAVGFFKDSISAAGDFESGMNQFSAVAGGALAESGLKLKDFRDQFIQIGKELPVSTAEVQKAAIEMVKGGIEPATIAAGGLRQVIQFAAAADLSLEEASTIAAKALGGWTDMAATATEKADFLTHSTDLLARAANASTVNVNDLALGLYNVQGTAKLAGVPFDEVVTILAQLAPSFASSSDAGTSFKSFLGSLQPKTKPAIAAMRALNLVTEDGQSVFYDAAGNFIGMEKASGILQGATQDLTEAQRIQMLQTIFGQDGIRVAAVLAEQGAEGYNHMTEAMAKQNSVSDMAKQKQAGFNTAMDNFKGSIEALQITIGEKFLPVLTTLFDDYLAPAVNTLIDLSSALFGDKEAFTRLSLPMQTVATVLGDIKAVVGDVVTGFGYNGLAGAFDAARARLDFLMPGIGGFLDTGREVATFIGDNLQPILAGLAAMLIAVVVPAFTAWAAVAGPAALATVTALAPVIITVAAIGVAVAILVKAWNEDWGGIRTTITDFWETTGKPIFDQLVTWLETNIPKAITVVSDFWTNTLWPALQKVWAFISGSIIPIIGTLVGTTFTILKAGIVTLAGFWTDTLWPALQKVWAFIDDNIIPLFKALANVHMAVMNKAINVLAGFWNDTLYPAIEKVYNWFNDNIVPIFAKVDSGSSDVAKAINTVLGPAFNWLGDHVLAPVIKWFEGISKSIKDAVGWLNDLADKINSLPGVPVQYEGHSPPPIATWMDAIAQSSNNAASGIAAAIEAVSNAPSSIPSWITSGGGGSGGGGVWGNDGGGGGGGGGDIPWPIRAIASASALMARGGGGGSATYNQQRTANITYHTQHAPPVPHSLAIAAALGAGA